MTEHQRRMKEGMGGGTVVGEIAYIAKLVASVPGVEVGWEQGIARRTGRPILNNGI